MQSAEKTAAAEPWATQGPGNAQTTQPKSGTLFFYQPSGVVMQMTKETKVLFP